MKIALALGVLLSCVLLVALDARPVFALLPIGLMALLQWGPWNR